MSGRARAWLVVGGAAAVIGLAALLAPGGSGGPSTLDDRVHEIAYGLRCPVCQNLSVADSPSRLAGEMRTEIETQLLAGRSPEQVRAYFVERYGEWVLLAPTRRGLNLVPWLVPVVGVIAGTAIWLVLVRRRAAPARQAVSSGERSRIERELRGLEEPG
ncbi:MAG: cytochrome c-type biogenesis protein CcmH [Actinobacteria bacterium]|nr:cytochrome c-type biogenesis protein CcmH [Actinomycetota bacterium]